ncbi:MAG: MopE-related protein, partial [Deltaproteobacteria bacterium]
MIRRFGLWGLVLCAVSLGACTEEAPLAPDMPMRMRPDGGGIDGAWVTEDAPPSLVTRCGEMMPASDFAGPYCPGRDEDGDGFGACDCCDSTDEGCTEPARVNPGAIEVAGNGLDDDCDGTVDNAEMAPCDADLRSASADPFEYARAMDLCRRADAASGRWGVIEARFALAGGCGDPASAQRSIRPAFGATPLQRGASMVVLSSGSAAAPGQTDPGFTPFYSG